MSAGAVEALTRSYVLVGIDLFPRKRIMGWRAKRVRVAFILDMVVVGCMEMRVKKLGISRGVGK